MLPFGIMGITLGPDEALRLAGSDAAFGGGDGAASLPSPVNEESKASISAWERISAKSVPQKREPERLERRHSAEWQKETHGAVSRRDHARGAKSVDDAESAWRGTTLGNVIPPSVCRQIRVRIPSPLIIGANRPLLEPESVPDNV